MVKTKSATYSFQVRARDPSQQKTMEHTLKNLQTTFPEIDTQIQVLSEKLTPYEVILLIAISVAADITSKILINFLDRLWDTLTRQKIPSLLPTLDSVQMAAEDYLRHLGVIQFQLVQKQDRGLYVFFAFKEATGVSHLIYITKFDKQVIEYRRT